jgi:hypothetical protein
MYCRLSYVSKGVLPLKTPAPLYICTSIKQYNHLTFGGTPLSNNSFVGSVIRKKISAARQFLEKQRAFCL